VNGSGGGSAAALTNMSPARAWIPGRLGRTVDLGGAGYLAAPATASWNALAGVTVAAWVQRRSDDARLAVVLRRATSADPTREHLSLDLRDNRLGGEDDFFLGGLIDEIAAWGRALGPAEVARLARGEQPAAR
jgi:hypothetical protein